MKPPPLLHRARACRPACSATPAHLATALLATLLLGGCAGHSAYREGRDLLAQGRTAEAMTRLDDALRAQPDSVPHRLAAQRAREQHLDGLLQTAQRQRAAGAFDAARRSLADALALQPGHEAATSALRDIDRDQRARSHLARAEAAQAAQRPDAAREHLRAALAEDPRHPLALRLANALAPLLTPRVADAALDAAYRKPVTLEFKDAPLRSVFELLSRSAGLNFILDRDVRADQKATVFLRNASVESALQLLLLSHQLERRVLDSHTVLIYPNTAAKQKDYQLLTIKSFYLANAEAKTVAATLKTLLKTRDVVVDEKLNLLIVRDGPEALRLAEKLVALHDLPEPEVMLEVEILEVKRTRLLDLGVRWPDQLSLTPLPGAAGGALTLDDLRGLSGQRLGAGLGPLTVRARSDAAVANILANPRIRARNREKARILIGERVPNITATTTATGFVAESVSYVDVGLKLEVEPTVHLDGEVAIKVALEVSNIIRELQTKTGSVAYQIGTRTAQTVLRLRDGENQVLAGLINDEDRRTAHKVPALGDVPVVGRLFGNQADDGSKTEIVLSITPRIVRGLARPAAALGEFDSGTENNLGARLPAAPPRGP